MWARVPPPSLPRKGLLWLCERLKGNMRREFRNEKYPFNCTDFASLNLRIYTYRAHTPRMGKSRDLYIPSSLSIKRTNQAEKDATPLITSRVRNHIKMLRTAMAMQIIICPGLIVPSTVMDKVPMFIKVCAGYPNCRRRNVSTR